MQLKKKKKQIKYILKLIFFIKIQIIIQLSIIVLDFTETGRSKFGDAFASDWLSSSRI